jgi:ubiquinone/menaquinone biosynthesis C-methylase UbiE
MQVKLASVLEKGSSVLGADGIYSARQPEPTMEQQRELTLRGEVAGKHVADYLTTIGRNHSIPVMDYEVDRFLAKMPNGALILDVGGCWGWHWRRLASDRPDVGVIVVDFVRGNLVHARAMLGSLVGTQVALMHADATSLPFLDGTQTAEGFDGVWTVQVFQHIPNFALACREAHRVLRRGGTLTNYSLNATPLSRMIHALLRRPYHKKGMLRDEFLLNRASDAQRVIVAEVFGGTITERFTECLFHPDLRLTFTGRSGSPLGRLDALLGGLPLVGRWIARQRGFVAVKK